MKAYQVAQTVAFMCGVALDQLSKRWAELTLVSRPFVALVPGYLDFRFTRNTGAFFSLGGDLPAGPRRWLLIAASTLVLWLIAGLYRKAAGQLRLRWALCLLSSGAVGNLIDRVRYGSVVDFVHLHFGSAFHWATFNLADVWITAGLVLLVVDAFGPKTTREGVERLSQPAREGIG
jgi:signal peptidase II